MNQSDPHVSVAAPPAARPWPRGQRLGNFELIETVASGDGGFVYRAFDHALARQVAVKEFLPAALAGRDHAQGGHLDCADLDRSGTAGEEGAAGRRADRRPHNAG